MDHITWQNAIQFVIGILIGWAIKLIADVVKNRSAIEYITSQMHELTIKIDRDNTVIHKRLTDASIDVQKTIDQAENAGRLNNQHDQSIAKINDIVARLDEQTSQNSTRLDQCDKITGEIAEILYILKHQK